VSLEGKILFRGFLRIRGRFVHREGKKYNTISDE